MNTWLGRISAVSPKARVFLAVFVVLALGVALYFGLRRGRDEEIARPDASGRARAAQIAALTRDQDADGLKDWEEAIFRTDPQNPDTDGDGTQDGEEIRSNRDPLIPGPDDALATSTPAFVNWEDAPPGSINVTGRLAQALGQQLIAQRLINPEKTLDPKKIAEQITEGTPIYAPSAPPLTAKDIIITKDESAAAIAVWARHFDTANKEAFGDDNEAEVLILMQAIQNDDYQLLAKMDRRLHGYDTALAKIKRLPVPAPLASYQIRYLQILAEWQRIVAMFRSAEEDPVLAASQIKPYFALVKRLEEWHQGLWQEFANRNVTF